MTAAVPPDLTASTPGAAAAVSLAVPASYTPPAPSQSGQPAPASTPAGGYTDPNAVPPIPSAQAGNNMPLMSTGYGPGGFGAAPRVVMGDSLGVGMMQSGGLPGIAQGSVPPGVVRDRINALPDGALGGKQVVISTGLSNSGTPQQRQADLAVVQQQVDAARAKGAASVVLAGVGDARFPGINAGIADIAQRNNVAFTGPAPVADAAGVHPGPNGYRAMLAAAPGVPQAASDGGATQRLQATLAGLRQPAAAAPAASPIVHAAYDPYSQAMAAAQAATPAAPGTAAPPPPMTPFDRAMAAAQAATRTPAVAPAAPAPPGSPATPASTAPSPPNGATAPGGAPAASDAFSAALAAAQRASATPPAPAALGSPPAPAQGTPAATQSATPPAAVPGQPHAGTGVMGQLSNYAEAAGQSVLDASRGLYGAIDAANRAGPSWLAPDGSLVDRLINPAAAIPNLDAERAIYERSGVGDTLAGTAGKLTGQTALTLPVLADAAPAVAAVGRGIATGADAIAPQLGAALRYGGNLVSGTAGSENRLINAVMRPASLAANGAAQGATVNLLTGDQDPVTNLLTGAAAGAVLGPAATGAVNLVRGGAAALHGLVEPFTTTGQGAIADRALAEMAVRGGGPLTPDATAYVPGSTPTLAQATNNAGLAGAERVVSAVRPGPFVGQTTVNNEARDTLLNRLTGSPTDIEAAETARDATALPAMLNPIANATGPANAQLAVDTIDQILASPAGQRDAVQSALGNVRSKLVSPPAPLADRVTGALAPITDAIANGGTGDAGLWAARDALVAAQNGGAQQASTLARLQGTTSPDPAYQSLIDQAAARVGATNTVESDVGQLHGIRQAIGDALSSTAVGAGSDARLASSELMQVKAQIDNAIEGVAPGFKAGQAEYADASRPIDAMRYLQKRNFTAANGDITLSNVKNTLDDIAKQQALPGPRDAKSITPDTLTSLQALYADILRQNNSRTGMAVGSNTFQNLGTAATLSNFGAPLSVAAHLINKVPVLGNMLTGTIGRAYEAQNAPVLDAVVNRLLNPTAGASVLREAGRLQDQRAAGPAGVNLLINPLGLGAVNAATFRQP